MPLYTIGSPALTSRQVATNQSVSHGATGDKFDQCSRFLQEDSFPDRALMPRLPGLVHLSKRHSMEVFSNAEWQSEERDRYLREYLNDIELAKAQLDELRRRIAGGKAGG
jgi:hypothetical protein